MSQIREGILLRDLAIFSFAIMSAIIVLLSFIRLSQMRDFWRKKRVILRSKIKARVEVITKMTFIRF